MSEKKITIDHHIIWFEEEQNKLCIYIFSFKVYLDLDLIVYIYIIKFEVQNKNNFSTYLSHLFSLFSFILTILLILFLNNFRHLLYKYKTELNYFNFLLYISNFF